MMERAITRLQLVAPFALLLLVGCRPAIPAPTFPPPEKLPEIPRPHEDEPVPEIPPPVTSTTVAPR